MTSTLSSLLHSSCIRRSVNQQTTWHSCRNVDMRSANNIIIEIIILL